MNQKKRLSCVWVSVCVAASSMGPRAGAQCGPGFGAPAPSPWHASEPALPRAELVNGDEAYYFELFAHTARLSALEATPEHVDFVRAVVAGRYDGERAAALYAELRATLPRLSLVWNDDTLEWKGMAELVVARTLPRVVMIEVENATAAPQLFKAYFVEPRDSNTGATPAGETRGMVAPLSADVSAQVQLFVRAGAQERSVVLPVVAVEPATILGLVLGDTGPVVPARVRARGGDGELRHAQAFANNETLSEKSIAPPHFNKNYKLPFFYCDGSFEVRVHPGWVDLTAERGFEHRAVTQRVWVEPGQTLSVTLEPERFIDLAAAGWYSGDTHVHWVKNWWDENEDLELLELVQRAEDVRVVNNLTLRAYRASENLDFTKPDHAPMGPIPGHDSGPYRIQMAEEYRNSPFYAHLNLLNLVANPPDDPTGLIQPISTGDEMGVLAEDFPINATQVALARLQQPAESRPIVTAAHGIAGSVLAGIALGWIDALDQTDPEDYYRVLDCGFRLPLTDGADHPARLVGETRCYVRVDGAFSYGAWIDGILAGATFTTSGPLLLFSVAGQGPGGEARATAGEPLSVELHAFSRDPLGHVQILRNGELVYAGQHTESEITLELSFPALESAWWVARCSNVDEPRFHSLSERNTAHTSAVYTLVDDEPIFNDSGAAQNLRDRCQGGADFVAQSGLFYAPDAYKKLAQARSVFERGRDAYQALIDGQVE